MNTFTPTDEQEIIRGLLLHRENMVVEAGAGTGKTSTLKYLARSNPRTTFQYVAFNKALVLDAVKTMPKNVRSRTGHSLAFGAAGRAFKPRIDTSRRMPSDVIGRRLAIDPFTIKYGAASRVLSPGKLGGIVLTALKNFCASADRELAPGHFSYVLGIDEPRPDGRRGWTNNLAIRAHLMPALHRAWADAQRPDGWLPYQHGWYLKLAQLQGMRIHRDVIVVDEAQDLSPVLLDIVRQQTHARVVLVGDSAQAIYGFTGAVDALELAREADPTANRAQLSQSFRFGPAVAEIANQLLGWLDVDLRLKGLPSIPSRIAPLTSPRAILTRTNACAVAELLAAIGMGRRPHLVGGGEDVIYFAESAAKLKAGMPTDHPDLACFDTWAQVQAYVEEDEQGVELKLFVKLIDEFGVDVILGALRNMPPEAAADLIISTAHKSKGREWDTVRLGPDFPEVMGEGADFADETRLLYVACTRARKVLDLDSVEGLSLALGMVEEPVAAAAGVLPWDGLA